MNVFFIIILVALLLDFVLGLVADLLNLKALRLEPPPALSGIYKPEEYRKSQQYLGMTTRFGLVSSAFSLVVLLAFWLSGGFNWFDNIVRASNLPPIIAGLVYIVALLLALQLIMLPFGIYRTFVIEQRFGFNKTTRRTFVLDQLKELALTVIIGVPLLLAVLALFQYAGAYAWLYCWAAVTAFSLVAQYVAPTWIMPLFNKFKPLEAGELRDAIFEYARSVEFPLKNVMVMDGSKRSTKSNAFFTGYGKNKRIALFDTLIANHTVPEMVAVLAHEVGHYKKKHIVQGMAIGILHTGVLFFLMSLFLRSPGLYQAFYMTHHPIYAGLVFFGMLYTPLEMLLSMVMQMLSRKNEYEADRFAAETISDQRPMEDALKKLSVTNLSNLTPHPFYVFLNYSHPPLLQRLQAIENTKRKRETASR